MSKNIVKQEFKVTRKDRAVLSGHNSFLVWFTGLSGSGKSTIANALELYLVKKDIHTYSIDGDNIRLGLNKDLSFSPDDRSENIRRIAEVANLFVDGGVVTLAAFISPYLKDREKIRSIVGANNFIEVFVDTPIEICEKRDVKGLYQKARSGEIKSFTGISAPYEAPLTPDITLDTSTISLDECVKIVYDYIEMKLELK